MAFRRRGRFRRRRRSFGRRRRRRGRGGVQRIGYRM